MGETQKLGWTGDANAVSVSSDFDESYGALFYDIGKGDMPQVGRNYSFDGLIYPKRYSIFPTVNQGGSPGVSSSLE